MMPPMAYDPLALRRDTQDADRASLPPAPGPQRPTYMSQFDPPTRAALPEPPPGEGGAYDIETQFWADDESQAELIAKARGLGETPSDSFRGMILGGRVANGTDGPVLPSEWFASGNYPRALHAACWLGMVACASGVATGQELLSDGGVIHGLAHMIDVDFGGGASPDNVAFYEETKPLILAALTDLEARTPGFQKYKITPSAPVVVNPEKTAVEAPSAAKAA